MQTAPRDIATQRDGANVTALYDRDYVADYNKFYLHPWGRKHDLNLHYIEQALASCASPQKAWLDLCCGQAWHFTHFPSAIRKVGVDLSRPQLEIAVKQNPDGEFHRQNVLDVALDERFDLVTCFWAAYCYLDRDDAIAALLRRVVDWTRPGGAAYFEILQASDLQTFNRSLYAQKTGYRVTARNDDCSKWSYHDSAGRHDMTSPPLEFFIDLLTPHFDAIEAEHDGGFMTHLIATHKR